MFPHERSLVERLENEPFALVGVNTDGDADEYRRQLAEHGVTWRSSWQGSTEGPIPSGWGIDSYPTIFVLDADHVLRHVDVRCEQLGHAVDALLAELELERPLLADRIETIFLGGGTPTLTERRGARRACSRRCRRAGATCRRRTRSRRSSGAASASSGSTR